METPSIYLFMRFFPVLLIFIYPILNQFVKSHVRNKKKRRYYRQGHMIYRIISSLNHLFMSFFFFVYFSCHIHTHTHICKNVKKISFSSSFSTWELYKYCNTTCPPILFKKTWISFVSYYWYKKKIYGEDEKWYCSSYNMNVFFYYYHFLSKKKSFLSFLLLIK